MECYFVFGIYFLICIMFIPYCNQYSYSIKNKKVINISLFLLLFLLGALRNTHTGIDTPNYVFWFEQMSNDFSVIWDIAIKGLDTEQGYYILAFLFRNISTCGSVWLAFLLLIFLISFSILVYKHSDCEPISYIFIVALFINSFVWQGLRQSLAMTICIWSFFFLKDKKWIQFGLLILLAFMFHRSSFLFVLAIIGLYIKPDWKYFVILVVVFLIAYIMPSYFNDIILNVFTGESEFSDRISAYGKTVDLDSSFKLFFVLLIFYILGFIHKDELIKRNKLNGFFINMAFFACCFQAMAVSITEFFRVAYYFSVFDAILVANICQLYSEKYPKYHLRLILVLLMIVVFFVAGGFDYWFIWEDKPW